MDINILKVYELQNVGKGPVNNIDPTNLLEIYNVQNLTLWRKSNGYSSLVPYFSGSQGNGDYSLAEGFQTVANGNNSHAEGSNTEASGISSHAEGNSTLSFGVYSHAEGDTSVASGESSHAEGKRTEALGDFSHAEGNQTIAIGFSSHAEGELTEANGEYSHAGGYQSKANSFASFVHGYNSQVNGDYSIVLGRNITGDTADTTYVDNLSIKTVPSGTLVNNLGIDADGRVIIGSTGGGSGSTVVDATSSIKGILRLTGDLGGTADAPTTPTALHKTGNESFSGQKNTVNTSTSFDNGLWLKNTGGLGGYSMLIENTNAGSGGSVQNTGVGSGLLIFNQSTGQGIQLANQSTGRGIFVTNSSTGRGIDVTNTSSGSGIRTVNSSPTGRGFTSENSFSGSGIYSLNTSSGNGIYSQNQDTGNGIVSNSIFTAIGGFNFVGQNDGVNTFTVNKLGAITANSYAKIGGTSTQMLMADGSVKENQDNLQKEITSNYTLVNADNNHTIFINNGSTPITITLNTSITTPNFGVGFIQEGTGDVTFVGTGVSLTNPIGLKSKGQGESTYIERKLNTSTYYLLGDTKI